MKESKVSEETEEVLQPCLAWLKLLQLINAIADLQWFLCLLQQRKSTAV